LMMRLSTSRPSWSVPSGCTQVGSISRSGTEILLGSNGAMTSANTPVKTSSITSPKPTRPIGFCAMRRSDSEAHRAKAARRDCDGRTMSEVLADTGIEEGHEQVGEQGGADEDRHGHHDRTHHDGIVARVGGIHDDAPDAVAIEHDFGEDRPREKR